MNVSHCAMPAQMGDPAYGKAGFAGRSRGFRKPDSLQRDYQIPNDVFEQLKAYWEQSAGDHPQRVCFRDVCALWSVGLSLEEMKFVFPYVSEAREDYQTISAGSVLLLIRFLGRVDSLRNFSIREVIHRIVCAQYDRIGWDRAAVAASDVDRIVSGYVRDLMEQKRSVGRSA